MKIHTGIKTHICSICNKSFRDSQGLKCHIRVHTGETPYICHICGSGFKQSGALASHKKDHLKEMKKSEAEINSVDNSNK